MLLALISAASADTITLDSGTAIEGDLARYEYGGDCQISVTDGELSGVIVIVPCRRVASFVRTSPQEAIVIGQGDLVPTLRMEEPPAAPFAPLGPLEPVEALAAMPAPVAEVPLAPLAAPLAPLAVAAPAPVVAPAVPVVAAPAVSATPASAIAAMPAPLPAIVSLPATEVVLPTDPPTLALEPLAMPDEPIIPRDWEAPAMGTMDAAAEEEQVAAPPPAPAEPRAIRF